MTCEMTPVADILIDFMMMGIERGKEKVRTDPGDQGWEEGVEADSQGTVEMDGMEGSGNVTR